MIFIRLKIYSKTVVLSCTISIAKTFVLINRHCDLHLCLLPLNVCTHVHIYLLWVFCKLVKYTLSYQCAK